MTKLLSDLASLYWWVSVVLVGLLINLASAYLKPRLDSWLSQRSERASAKRASLNAAFEASVEKLVANPTSLLIAGQKLQDIQYQILSASLFVVFLLLLNVFSATSQSGSLVFQVLQVIAAVGLPIAMIVHFALMRMESELEDRVKEARRRYESVGR
jgi:predicted histidine transporter YuiF (NhaC family)